jgi:hypothetical protein
VIITVDAAACRVLTSNSTLDQPDVRTCRITDIAKKLRGRNFTAMDAGNNVVSPGDMVRAAHRPGVPACQGCPCPGLTAQHPPTHTSPAHTCPPAPTPRP